WLKQDAISEKLLGEHVSEKSSDFYSDSNYYSFNLYLDQFIDNLQRLRKSISPKSKFSNLNILFKKILQNNEFIIMRNYCSKDLEY
ncbi:hypothetical protein BB561_006538, partial [Smittium simulii]